MSPLRSIPGPPRLTIALALAVSLLVIEVRVLLGGETWDDIPYHTEVAPPRLAASDAVLRGELPGWWDGSGLGVPLLGQPSHGAVYPATWLATSSQALDWIMLAHLLWLALGVAFFARRLGASDLASTAVGLVAAASGIAASAATRGALPAIAHLPWIGWAALGIARAPDLVSDTNYPKQMVTMKLVSDTSYAAVVALGLLLGAVGLSGELGVLVDAVVLAIVIGARRGQLRGLAVAICAGLAMSAVQWVPALGVLGSSAGGELHALKPSRLLELVVPGCFGGTTAERAISSIAGEHPGWPSLFAGAAIFALALVAHAPRRMAGITLVFAALALVVARGGGWPAWIGAPELHLAALVLVVCACAARGIDALVDKQRRAFVSVISAALVSAVALGAVAIARSRTASPSLDQALVHGCIGLGCLAAAAAFGARARAGGAKAIVVAALIVAPTVGALGITAPLVERASVATPPLWAEAARAADNGLAPRRVFRPPSLFDDRAKSVVADAVATLSGDAPALFGLAAARSDDPARVPMHDRAWLAAANDGGALLARFGIGLAVLPASAMDPKRVSILAQRGSWALVRYPATPAAAIVPEWIWIPDDAAAIARLFPAGGNALPTGLVILRGQGTDHQDEPGAPEPCNIARWTPGAIDLTCVAQTEAMAVVSSSPAHGWSVHVAGRDTPWLVADVLRRAVPLPAGASVVSWRFVPPGLFAGVVAAAIGGLGLLAYCVLAALATRRRRRDRASRETS